ncbi:MAG: glucosamine-6-phosphate deaminase [Clostridia bacterium]|nr:glucosamine-6-phosphate deaminase [Clostridia bacterium]
MSVLKSLVCGKMHVSVMDSRDEMGKEAAKKAGECIRGLLAKKDEINMIFAAAPSQNETLKYLIENENIDWTKVNAYHMDEYVGLKSGSEQTFGYYLNEHIFSKAPFKSVNYIKGDNENAKAECERYAGLLKNNPVDVVMLGIGENAHIAFNDPWVADFNDPEWVKIVPLDAVCRQQQVNDGCFEKLSDVPEYALTLTIPALISAKHMFCTVPAKTKANAVKNTIEGEISKDVPATIMRLHDDAWMFLDPDSGKSILE